MYLYVASVLVYFNIILASWRVGGFKQLRSALCPSISPFIYSSLILLSIDIMTIIHGNVGTVIIGVECATSYSQVILCSKAAILHCIF